MKIRIITEFSVPDMDHKVRRVYFFPSIRSAALVLGCNPRHLSDQLKGRRQETLSDVGNIILIETHQDNVELERAPLEDPKPSFWQIMKDVIWPKKG